MNNTTCNNSIQLTIDTEELKARQVRVMKSIVSTLSYVMKTKNEAEYFEASSELMKLVASAVKDANFNDQAEKGDIAYATQALEFCVDNLLDHIQSSEVIRYDN